MLVQGVGGDDLDPGQAGLVQHGPGPGGEVGQVAGVDADAAPGDAQLPEHPDGRGHAGLEDAVGVHQQNGVVRINLAVGAEGGVLVVVHLHPGVGHGPRGGHAVQLVGHGAGGAGAAGDVAGPGPQQSAAGTLGPAGAELGHRPPLGRPDDAAGLGGDEGLVVQGEQQIGLQKLGLDRRGPDGHDGLPGEHRRALGHGPDVPGEAEVPQPVQKFRGKDPLGPEIGQVVLVKAQVADILHCLLQPGGDDKAAPVGHVPVKNVEIADVVPFVALEVAVGHGQLVKVEQHGVVDPVLHGRAPFSAC